MIPSIRSLHFDWTGYRKSKHSIGQDTNDWHAVGGVSPHAALLGYNGGLHIVYPWKSKFFSLSELVSVYDLEIKSTRDSVRNKISEIKVLFVHVVVTSAEHPTCNFKIHITKFPSNYLIVHIFVLIISDNEPTSCIRINVLVFSLTRLEIKLGTSQTWNKSSLTGGYN